LFYLTAKSNCHEKITVIAVSSNFPATSLSAQRTIVHCGQLIDTRKLQVLKEMSVIIEGNKVVDVQKGYTAGAPGDKTIDLKSKTVMPGLIDMHVHLEARPIPIIISTALRSTPVIMHSRRSFLPNAR
jgi:adenine deaminase